MCKIKNAFENAAADYRFLRNRGYPKRGALKLVGDRYRLSTLERNTLFRGIVPENDGAPRRRKLQPPGALAGQPLGIDWFNVLITLESYLKGFPVFVADDGVLRDASGVHASYRPGPVSARAARELLIAVAGLAPAAADFFLDAPIPFSGAMAGGLREQLARELPVAATVQVVPSADFALKTYPGVVASSDSVIMDSAGRVFDLPRHVLETRFDTRAQPLP